VAFAAAVLALAPAAASPAAEKVSVQLIWVHQAQFAGVYLAQDLGLFRQAGLEVEILPGGPGVEPLHRLLHGDADFALAWLSGGLQLRSQGYPVVHLAQVVQRSALLLVSLKGRDITRPADLAGRKVGLWGGHFNLQPRALFAREGISVQEIPQNASMSPLLRRAVDAAAAMRYNEYHQLIQAGLDPEEIQVLDLARLGLNFPEDGIYTLAQTWESRPGVCRRFVRAVLEGWRQSTLQPELALAAVMERVDAARLASNPAHQRWMLDTMHQLVTHRVGPGGLGRLSAQDLALVNRVLVEQGLMDLPVDPVGFVVPAWRPQP
jgi:NitT/TauT family transport system substrate-binding protein